MAIKGSGLAGSATLQTVRSSPVRQFLDAYRNRKVFRAPLKFGHDGWIGNNGDKLIALGADRLLREHGVCLVDSPSVADLILLDGNGGMHDKYQAIPGIFRRLAAAYPKTPIVMLPASYFFSTGQMAELIGDRDGSVTLFCRERYSYDHLLKDHQLPEICRVELDHDLAFHLSDEDWVSALRDSVAETVLIVDRLDAENVTTDFRRSWQFDLRRQVGRTIPPPLRKRLYPVGARLLGARKTPMRRRSEQLLAEYFPDEKRPSIVAMDISLPKCCSFHDFCRHIAEAKVIFTTRLHVGIFASVLGRTTFIFEGPYHKIRGVYEHSLAGVPGVHLVES